MSRDTSGVSRRAYARSRNISEATVRKYVAEGKLAQAVLPDGTLDAERADQLLASSIVRGNALPVALVTARIRKLRVQVQSLHDEVSELQRKVLPPDVAASMVGELDYHLVTRHIRPIAERVAPAVAGRQAEAAHVVLRDAIIDLLETITSSAPIFDPVDEEAELELDGTTETQLLAMRTNLQAEKLEIERALAKGRLRRTSEIIEECEEKGAISKSLLLALPGRLAIFMENASVEQARALIAAELEQAIAALEWP